MNWKNNKGINMITLSIAVIILVVITSVLVYNAKDGTKVKKLNNLYNDIEQLNYEVSNYYLKHGDLPKGEEYTDVAFIDSLDATQKNPNNEGQYYVIDLNALEGITLNYGKKFSNSSAEEKDIYIINEVSHTIYYPRGIELEGTTYYTEPDEWEEIDLSNIPIITIAEFKIEGTSVTTPPIPSGYCYVGGTIESGFVISDNVADENKYASSEDVGNDLAGNQFVWVPVDQDQQITIKVSSKEDITSIVLTNPVGEEKTIGNESSKKYTVDPSSFTKTYNGVYRLVVTTSSTTKKEYLYVHSLYAQDTQNDWHYGTNATDEELLEDWLGSYSEPADTIDYEDKVATNGGFYVGRYEATYGASGALSKAGTSTRTSDSTTLTEGMLWNYISQTDALSTAKGYNTSLNSSLLTGASWDRTLGWIYETGNKTASQIVMDSKDWGNYYDDTFSGTTSLINTGAFEQTKANNIYDLAGNVREWTTEALDTSNRVNRGGNYGNYGSDSPSSNRTGNSPSYTGNNLGFRLALYL